MSKASSSGESPKRYDLMKTTLKVLKVYRYTTSGKLIAALDQSCVFPLNTDLSFSVKKAHSVKWSTLLELTPYRIEVEFVNGSNVYRTIRTWNENNIPAKTQNPSAPLEQRIDITPSEQFNDAENKYIGQSDGHPIGIILISAAFILIFFVGIWGWWPSGLVLITGIIVSRATKKAGDPNLINEIKLAKQRVREKVKKDLQVAMQNIDIWVTLDGIEFENWVAEIFRDQGFDVDHTPRSNDQGVDLIFRKSGKIAIVQCKKYSKNVGIATVRELAGVRLSWPNADAVLVTLFDFSKATRDFAKKHNIKLFSVARDFLGSEYRPGR